MSVWQCNYCAAVFAGRGKGGHLRVGACADAHKASGAGGGAGGGGAGQAGGSGDVGDGRDGGDDGGGNFGFGGDDDAGGGFGDGGGGPGSAIGSSSASSVSPPPSAGAASDDEDDGRVFWGAASDDDALGEECALAASGAGDAPPPPAAAAAVAPDEAAAPLLGSPALLASLREPPVAFSLALARLGSERGFSLSDVAAVDRLFRTFAQVSLDARAADPASPPLAETVLAMPAPSTTRTRIVESLMPASGLSRDDLRRVSAHGTALPLMAQIVRVLADPALGGPGDVPTIYLPEQQKALCATGSVGSAGSSSAAIAEYARITSYVSARPEFLELQDAYERAGKRLRVFPLGLLMYMDGVVIGRGGKISVKRFAARLLCGSPRLESSGFLDRMQCVKDAIRERLRPDARHWQQQVNNSSVRRKRRVGRETQPRWRGSGERLKKSRVATALRNKLFAARNSAFARARSAAVDSLDTCQTEAAWVMRGRVS